MALAGAASRRVLGSTSAEYTAYVKKELARWAQVVKASGVTID